MTPQKFRLALTAFLALGLSIGLSSESTGQAPRKPRPQSVAPKKGQMENPKFAEVQKLIGEQKFSAAWDQNKIVLAKARASNDERVMTEALILATQLRIGLGGYETAVKELRAEAWPKAPLERLLLHLYYGSTLSIYNQAYRYEISKRELVKSTNEVDLKAWTTEQIGSEIRRSFDEALKTGEALSKPAPAFMKDYLVPNSYPEGVRPLLRDAVTYLATEHLANTGFWTPAETNERYQLPFAELAKGNAAPNAVALTDEKTHPLVKTASLLNALREFHEKAGRVNAALEARYELLRRLHSSATETQDRQSVRAALVALQAKSTSADWWTVGQSMLADFFRADDSMADRYVQAVKAATTGVDRAPQSFGGQTCAAIREEILSPKLTIRQMRADGFARSSIEIEYAQLNRVYFRAYRLPLEERLAKVRRYNLFSFEDRDISDALKASRYGAPVAEWSATLLETTDHHLHRVFSTPPMREPGAYIIVGSVLPSFEKANNVLTFGHIILSDIILERLSGTKRETEVRALNGATGEPVEGVTITSYRDSWNEPPKVLKSIQSDKNGRAVFAEQKSESHFYFGKKGAHLAIFEDPRYEGGGYQAPAAEDAFIFTDRSVYRPEQKILWKTLAFAGDSVKGKYQVAANKAVSVLLFDANHQQIEKRDVKTNAFGTASGEFKIPAGRALGEWSIRVQAAKNEKSFTGNRSSVSLMVEEYKRPTFEAKFNPEQKESFRLNRKATLTGEARYYFGQPVANGKVNWRVRRTPVYPWWWFGYRPETSAAQMIASGTSPVKEDGSFKVEFTPIADERKAGAQTGVTYSFTVDADVTDDGGETRTASKAMRLGFVALEANVAMVTNFLKAKSPIEIPVRLNDLDGQPKRGKSQWKISRVAQPNQAPLPAELPRNEITRNKMLVLPGDKMRSRWETTFDWQQVTSSWAVAGKIAEGPLEHGADGRAVVRLKDGVPGGLYRLEIQAKDEFGQDLRVKKDFIVEGGFVALPLVVLPEKSSYKVGETARVLVVSGLESKQFLFDVYRAGERIDRKTVSAGQVFEMPVTDASRGGFSVLARGVRDYQSLEVPASVEVPWDNQQFQISLASFRDLLRPGAKETVKIAVKGSESYKLATGSVELLAYMYDRSLDFFRAHTYPQPIQLYPGRTGVPDADYSLGQTDSNILSHDLRRLRSTPSALPDRLEFLSGYGIGGMGRGGSLGRRMMKTFSEGESNEFAMADSGLMETRGGDMAKSARREESKEINLPPAPPAAETPAAASAPMPLRMNFSETAFWRPHLLLEKDGTVAFEFQVPDSLTSWNLYVHGVSKDLRSGSLKAEARSAKDLMVRPYLPRFLREGDEAEVRVVVNNATDKELKGEVRFDIEDPETGKSAVGEFGLSPNELKRAFKAPKNAGDTVVFKLRTPKKVGTYAIKVIAESGSVSDGERRVLPVLPSRMHLAQSRFVTLRENETKTMEFPDLAKGGDTTLINDRMVVTVDAQLFYGVLKALPYLATYPYECTEQTLNRFLSTGIVTSVFKKYPAVATMAAEFSKRETKNEAFDLADANQRMTMEESPWLQDAKGGGKEPGLVNVLDSRQATADRDKALMKLRKAQLPSGGFPWFEGGRESEYITLYILIGFARAHEFKIDVPKDVVSQAWRYMKTWRDRELRECMSHGGCQELVTMLSFALSSYPDLSWTGGVFTEADQKEFLAYSFERWKNHSPLLKAYLALNLSRAKRASDAKLVWDSVMDSAKSSPDLGVYWAPEDRSWLWYNDTIETQAFALRTQMELAPKDKRNDGLVQWLFLNKKLNHWKSTRATAEVIYSLVHFLDSTAALGKKEDVTVDVGGQSTKMTFEPEKYTGAKNQIVIDGPRIDGQRDSKILVKKGGAGFAFASSVWHFSTEKLPEAERGDFFNVTRRYFLREMNGKEWVLKPLAEGSKIKVGDQVEVQISMRTKHEAEYVHLRDPRGAGFEPEAVKSGYRYDTGLAYYQEIRDSGANYFFNWVPVGEYTFRYRVRANMAGNFRVGPATVQSLYAPEFNAYSSGQMLRVE